MSDKASNDTGIHSLPNEMLLKILKTTSDLPLPSPSSRPHLLALCGVSRHWRSLCFSGPEFWTVIDIPFHQARIQDPIEWASVRLERSKACLFDVFLDITSAQDATTGESTRQVLQLVANHIGRLRRLSVSAPSLRCQGIDFLSPLKPLLAPALTDLEILLYDYRRFASELTTNGRYNLFAQGVPRLSHQRLLGTNPLSPLTHLSSLEIYRVSITPSTCEMLFSDCPALRTLVLRGVWPLDEGTRLDMLPQVEAPSLVSLTFGQVRSHGAHISILSMFSCPNLEFLEFRGPAMSIPPSFVSRLAKLHTLRFTECSIVISSVNEQRMDFSALHTLPAVAHVQFFHSACEDILPVGDPLPQFRRRSLSIGSRAMAVRIGETGRNVDRDTLCIRRPPLVERANPGTSSVIWETLQSVVLDSIRPIDVLWLCNLVRDRQGSIHRVNLSHSAKRHLTGSLMVQGQDPDVVFLLASRKHRLEPDKMAMDRWMANRVQVREMEDVDLLGYVPLDFDGL
ncbi:uncharacterized protein BT62DRAFT_1081549 [Guyanagaster necrorhizus]|uniref:F-box domain-containing protein n=1 Tax=Guyanagaster necrorhizus TaxID=856835 RepID=A0A9P7VF85_9AGAR|nr:uncharacterized protein BT62DRAFT_1081549 [Guyanagaster necrorhizus MCA 3950]KAG7439482.1 hypothetical protein BT62DRAFT_1081549 [Guyanagaster necrorhizus MCA 3950]